MAAQSFDNLREISEQAPDWARDIVLPMKGGNGPRFSELVDAPVERLVAGDPEAGLWQPEKPKPRGEPKTRKGSGARKPRIIEWLCDPIAIEDMYRVSAASDVPPAAPLPVSCLDAALQWAKRGYAVFPSPPNTKKSYKSGKVHGGARWGATKDLAEIERDWRRWPDANLGLPTDADNGIFIIEADTLEGHPNLGEQDGFATLAAFELELGPLPETLMSESPSGSRHRFYKQPPGDPIHSKDGWRHGVDVKGEGGMAIIPPSCKGDKVYWWIMS
jgi:hypothetical protein